MHAFEIKNRNRVTVSLVLVFRSFLATTVGQHLLFTGQNGGSGVATAVAMAVLSGAARGEAIQVMVDVMFVVVHVKVVAVLMVPSTLARYGRCQWRYGRWRWRYGRRW